MKRRADFLDDILTAALTFFCIILWGHANLIQDTNQLCPGTPEPKTNKRGRLERLRGKKIEKELLDMNNSTTTVEEEVVVKEGTGKINGNEKITINK